MSEKEHVTHMCYDKGRNEIFKKVTLSHINPFLLKVVKENLNR